jgi:hypothetical protein
MSKDFKIWWHREGSGMPPLKGEEACEHVERVSAIAWANGSYKSNEALEDENARLKAEVERLKEDNRQLTNAFEIAEGIIKRMGKAAEAAAKEGKPSV